MPQKPPKIGQFALTAFEDVPDFRDWVYEPALIQLKKSLPRPRRLSILDQGVEGACTGFGLAAVVNLLNRRRGSRVLVSPRMLYEMAKKYDEWRGETYDGSSCRGAIKGWYNMGVCRDSYWPYQSNDPGQMTVKAAKDARSNTVGAYYRLGARISDYHAALNEAGVIYCSAQVHAGWSRSAVDKKTGEIPLRDADRGGHAFAIVGYHSKGFWVQNSWGEGWGKRGSALWSYEDWHRNVMDAWVLRLALPTPQIWHIPMSGMSDAARGQLEFGTRDPERAEIAGHFVHLDDGRFHDHGRYWSNLDDVRITAELLANSADYDHLLFYAHGGLNSPGDSARRIAAMKEVFKANRVYPYHFMYDTGVIEEIKDVVLGKEEEVSERAGGLMDWTDRLIEQATRVPGRALWREMKSGARLPFTADGDGSRVIATFLDTFWQAGRSDLQIHLVGHSTGAILLAYLLEALEQLVPTQRVATCSLMAPAATVDLFNSHYYPQLVADLGDCGIDQMTVYNLIDPLERDDHVIHVYRKSLLYLVSRAFEEQREAPILGMKIYSESIDDLGLSPLSFTYSRGKNGQSIDSESESHGGFDNDPVTMNHILGRILGGEPESGFSAENLVY
jgi:hypothetical protein